MDPISRKAFADIVTRHLDELKPYGLQRITSLEKDNPITFSIVYGTPFISFEYSWDFRENRMFGNLSRLQDGKVETGLVFGAPGTFLMKYHGVTDLPPFGVFPTEPEALVERWMCHEVQMLKTYAKLLLANEETAFPIQ